MWAIQADENPSSAALSRSSRSRLSACGPWRSAREVPMRIRVLRSRRRQAPQHPPVLDRGASGEYRDMSPGQASSVGKKKNVAKQSGHASSPVQAIASGPDRRSELVEPATVIAGAGSDAAVSPGPAGRPRDIATALPPDRFLDREESWLRFGQRVLELAEDPTVPLLERVRFESIFASALDEFFMVRVAGRIRRMATGLPVESASGKAPDLILENTLDLARDLAARHSRCFSDLLLPALNDAGIEILRWKELLPAEQAKLQRLFRERIYPVLTPLAVDPAHPFPFISGLSLSLAVMVADPRTGLTLFARVKVPPLLP